MANSLLHAAAQGAIPVGLVNLGNTCFFNSAVQVLAAAPPLQRHFTSPELVGKHGPLGAALEELMGVSQGGKNNPGAAKKSAGAYNPNRLLAAVCKIAPRFKGRQQQDSHELLRILLDGLETEELKQLKGKKAPQDKSEECEGEAKGQHSTPRSFIDSVFGGQLSSRISCTSCSYESVNLEPFMDLSLPIPAAAVASPEAKLAALNKKPLPAKSKKGKKASQEATEVEAEETAEQQKHLSAKEKKKRAQETRKQAKLERKKERQRVTASAGEDDAEEMVGLGSLFDDSSAVCEEGPAYSGGSLVDDWEPEAASTSPAAEVSLQGCLAAFFAKETVSWECPGEKAQRKEVSRRSRSGLSMDECESDAGAPVTPVGQPLARRTVSFSEEGPAVHWIPGSAEQRGTDFRKALQGRAHFCRPLKHDDAYLLITAETSILTRDKITLGIQPQDEMVATAAVLSGELELAVVDIEEIEDSEDEDEQRAVMTRAQVLMDCIADMVVVEGLEGMQQLIAGGMRLVELPSGGLQVRGETPEELGGGPWHYPHATPRSPERSNGPASPLKGGLTNVQREADKRYLIHRVPQLLTVHLKRFEQDLRGRLRKINGPVPFGFDLDIAPFCEPQALGGGGGRYTLVGVVEHLGELRSGHYVAYVHRTAPQPEAHPSGAGSNA
ncbi:hypothetical protein WJX72_006365 [[Myrmecia] bisecta]|uniref:Ubiquitin carboxyl-terminal hydrolase n=1 Tax=[Myrmecia] bisecta TaxID=41462 RepID=A0AAW1QS69_9CHLO